MDYSPRYPTWLFLSVCFLFDLLLQRVKLRCGEEIAKRNVQPVAELFDGHDTWIIALVIKNTLDGRLWKTAVIRNE